MDSATQEAWQEIANGIRDGLRKLGETIPAMNPSEVKEFVEAAQTAYWLEVNAAIFDHKVELEQSRTSAAE